MIASGFRRVLRRNPVRARGTPHVVIAGGGFAGLAALRTLRAAGARVTLIDQHVYSTFQPFLYQLATGGIDPGDVAYPLRACTERNVSFRRARLMAVDHQARTVALSGGGRLQYDYLILATGVSANYLGVEGAQENSFGLYTHPDAFNLRNKLLELLEDRSSAAVDSKSRRPLSIVVVGGGPTGVEIAGTLAELAGGLIPRAYPELSSDVRITVAQAGSDLLGPFDKDLRDYGLDQLRTRGVDVRLETRISAVQPGMVRLSSGEEMPADIAVWTAGVKAPAEVADWGFRQGHGGRVQVDETLRVRGQSRVFAAGDIALAPGDPLPQLAQPAIQEGKHTGREILRAERGQSAVAFAYRDRGIMATIARGSAVVQLPHRLKMTGLPAWLAWMALHIAVLAGGRNRASVMLNLASRYARSRRPGALIVGDLHALPARVDGSAPAEESDPGWTDEAGR
jgi:NADH dehydrogenase